MIWLTPYFDPKYLPMYFNVGFDSNGLFLFDNISEKYL